VSLEVITFYCLGGTGAGCNSALHDTALLVRLFCWLVSKSCTRVVFALLALLDVALFLICRSFMFFVQAGLLSHISSSGLAYTAHIIPHTTFITSKHSIFWTGYTIRLQDVKHPHILNRLLQLKQDMESS
jgi:hypothetical protein